MTGQLNTGSQKKKKPAADSHGRRPVDNAASQGQRQREPVPAAGTHDRRPSENVASQVQREPALSRDRLPSGKAAAQCTSFII